MNSNSKQINAEPVERGLVAGYAPNRVSFYILLLSIGRYDYLMDVLYKDMEKYIIGGTDNEV